MCGLVGVIGNLNLDDRVRFKHLLRMDVHRGEDSTGMFAVRDGNCEVYKSLANPVDFLDTKQVTQLMQGADNVLIGHNRAATKGAVNSVNAHPFKHGPITLVHNGTLDTVANLDKGWDFDTDSEAICYNLSQCETEAETHALLEKIEGAFALIWHDERDDCIRYIRNEERPLHILSAKDSRAMFFSSEQGVMYAAMTAGKNGYDLEDSPAKYITEVPEGELFTVSFDKQDNIDEVTSVKLNLSDPYSYWYNRGKGVHMGKSGTGYATGQQGSSGKYASGGNSGGVAPFKNKQIQEALKKHALIDPGWHKAYVNNFTEYNPGGERGKLELVLDGHNYNTIIVYGATKPAGNVTAVDVDIVGLYMTADGNRIGMDSNKLVLRGDKWRYTKEGEETADPKWECTNCGENISDGDGFIESQSFGKICARCYYADETIRDDLAVMDQVTEDDMLYTS